jgi:mannose-1-phosphate guanylyltransferase
VDKFREKPNKELAEKYIKQTNFYWNAGIFIWNVNTIINAFRVYQPEISEIFEDMLSYYNTPKEAELIKERFPQCESISVDYAILENAEEIYVFPADFGWSDVGTWRSLQKSLPTDANGNTCVGAQIETVETNNCIIHTTNFKKVVVQGLDGYLIVEQNGELLICKISEEEHFHKK